MGQAKNRGTFEQRRAAAGGHDRPMPSQSAAIAARERAKAIRASVKTHDPTIRRFIINKPEQASRLARLFAASHARRKASHVSRT